MKLIIESVNDEQYGPCYHFHGDADNEGLHAFSGIEYSLDAAYESAKDCIKMELSHFELINELEAVNKVAGRVNRWREG